MRNSAGRRRRARRAQKARRIDAAVGAPLRKKQAGDEVAAEDEEGVDAEEAAARPWKPA